MHALTLLSAIARLALANAGSLSQRHRSNFEHAVQEQLESVTPCDDISKHLAELAHLYEGTSPMLSNIYLLLAPLSPEALPGYPQLL